MGKNKEIIKVDLEGNEVCRYYNARAAWEDNNVTEDVMRKAIGKDKIINGYKFIFSGRFSDGVDKTGWKFKCPYCDEVFQTYNGLCKHVLRFKKHGEISQEQLLTDYAYGGVRPKCKCGCGGYTDISFEGGAHFCDYILGHASRVHNNWGHNEKAVINSANTRREQFKSGERVQWNKGTKWVETYDEETVQKLQEILHSKERGEKISQNIIRHIENKMFSVSSNLEENFIEEFVKPLGLEYKTQFLIEDIKQLADVYIPSKNTIIECEGDFWHCNPIKYPDGPKYAAQRKRVAKDLIKAKWCQDNNIKLLRIWEYDIINNPTDVKDILEKHLLSD